MRLIIASAALALLARSSVGVKPDNKTVAHSKPAPDRPVCRNKTFPHTHCYNYYYHKDGCVHGAVNEKQRCKVEKGNEGGHVSNVKLFHHPAEKPQGLQKRYDDPVKTFPVAGGDGACGFYNSTIRKGVCLWAGLDPTGNNPHAAGWVSGSNNANCGKTVYIQRKDEPSSVVYAPVLDACTLLADNDAAACPRIALTIETFNSLVPKGKTAADVGEVTWDFINLNGQDSANGAY